MTDVIRIKRRANGGGAGAPATLANAELAYGEDDDTLWIGWGTGGGGGSATVIKAIGGPGAFQAKLGFTPENVANKGIANGYASLDSGGKVPLGQLPAAVTGAVVYQGTWNATTNSPALASGVGTKGFYYKVSVAGTTAIDGHAVWGVGDTIIYDGTAWDKIDGQDSEVVSVAGRTGAVVLANTDVSGLGTMSTQNSGAVVITGGSIDGVTFDGGTF